MLPFVTIRQDVLEKWIGDSPKIDVTDALLIALIRSLDPKNPEVAKLMWCGHFMLACRYVREKLPLINLSPDWISRKLKRLQKIGLVDIRIRQTSKGKLRYVKLSRLYWQEEERVKRERPGSHTEYSPDGNSHTEYSPMGVQSETIRSTVPMIIYNDHKEEPAGRQAAGEPFGPPPGTGSEPKRDSLGIVPTEPEVPPFPDPGVSCSSVDFPELPEDPKGPLFEACEASGRDPRIAVGLGALKDQLRQKELAEKLKAAG